MGNIPQFVSEDLDTVLPEWLIHFLWFIIKDIPSDQLGRQQVFELKETATGQFIRLTQNHPTYRQEFCIPCPYAVNAKVSVIHDRYKVTMQLSAEQIEQSEPNNS